jgi:signal transduction histidine kinase
MVKGEHSKAEYCTAGVLFEDVSQLFAGKIKNRQVEVTIEGGEDVRFYGIVGQLGQVMANLVSNALQAVSLGGRIWLNATGYGDTMEISVRDDGHGMSDETRRNLFQPFFSTRGDLGNGLGLYVSQEIIDRNGGSITVRTQSGVGTEMLLRLLTSPPSDH